MADQNTRAVPKFRPRGQPSRNIGHVLGRVIEIVIILAVVYFIASWALNSVSVSNVSAPTTFTVSNQTTLFTLDGNEYSAVLLTSSASSGEISLTEQPAFLNPTFFVSLPLDNSTKVNGAGSYANMQIELTAVNPTSITITVTPVPTSLDLYPDSSRIVVVQTTLSPYGVPGGTVPPLSTTSSTSSTSTTTIASTSSSTSSTSSSTTTTVSTNYYDNALSALHQSLYYPLMVNYSNTYENTSSCSSSLYSSTYFSTYGSSPTGPDTYANVSGVVPSALTLSITNSTQTNYTATYSTVSEFLGTGTALIININAATGTIISTKIPEGSFFQDLNYSRILCGYNTAKDIGNACGIYVTSSSLHPSKC